MKPFTKAELGIIVDALADELDHEHLFEPASLDEIRVVYYKARAMFNQS